MKTKMVPGKLRKSFIKRFKLSKKGKLLKKSPGIDHCRVKRGKKNIKNKSKLDIAPKDFLEYDYY